MAYSRGQLAFLMRRFYGNRSEFRLKFECRKAANRLLNKFETIGRVMDNKMSVGSNKMFAKLSRF
jgi:hypothetical protein